MCFVTPAPRVFPWVDWRVPPDDGNFACPPQPPAIPAFWPEPLPPNGFCPWKCKDFTSCFSPFWLLFSSKLHQKALFLCLKHQTPGTFLWQSTYKVGLLFVLKLKINATLKLNLIIWTPSSKKPTYSHQCHCYTRERELYWHPRLLAGIL